MSKMLTPLSHAKDMIVGREVLDVEINEDNPEAPYIIIYLPGLRIYADSPAVYSDDSGDVEAAF